MPSVTTFAINTVRSNGMFLKRLKETPPPTIDQIGLPIEQKFSNFIIDINSAGNVVVAGSPYFDRSYTNINNLKVYSLSGTTWKQLGQTISTDTLKVTDRNDYFGGSVAINNAGTIIASGARANPGTGIFRGRVKVYKWNATTSIWDQLGSNINGENDNERFGNKITMNGDGTILASSIFKNIVRIYKWNGKEWIKSSEIIVSASNVGNIRLNDSGTRIFIVTNVGLKVYNLTGTKWIQIGSDITKYINLYGNISTNSTGDTVIYAATASQGATVFKWNGTNWIQMGQEILTSIWDSLLYVSINSAGNRIAITTFGSLYEDRFYGARSSTLIEIYDWDSKESTWKKIVDTMNPRKYWGISFTNGILNSTGDKIVSSSISFQQTNGYNYPAKITAWQIKTY